MADDVCPLICPKCGADLVWGSEPLPDEEGFARCPNPMCFRLWAVMWSMSGRIWVKGEM